MDNGWIKIHRQIREWEWWKSINTKVLFLELLLEANHKHSKWQGIEILPGQLIFGRKAMAEKCGLTEQNVRSAINNLKSTNEITIKSTNKYSLITINNWLKFQDVNQQTNQQTNQQLTSNQPTTNHTIRKKEYKNDKNTTTTVGVEKKLVKWFSSMEDVTSPNGLAKKFLNSYPPALIERALKNPQCTSRAKLTELIKHYDKRNTKN